MWWGMIIYIFTSYHISYFPIINFTFVFLLLFLGKEDFCKQFSHRKTWVRLWKNESLENSSHAKTWILHISFFKSMTTKFYLLGLGVGYYGWMKLLLLNLGSDYVTTDFSFPQISTVAFGYGVGWKQMQLHSLKCLSGHSFSFQECSVNLRDALQSFSTPLN